MDNFYGWGGALADGIKQGLQAYQSERKRKQDEQNDRIDRELKAAEQGKKITEDGQIVEMGPSEKQRRQAEKDAWERKAKIYGLLTPDQKEGSAGGISLLNELTKSKEPGLLGKQSEAPTETPRGLLSPDFAASPFAVSEGYKTKKQREFDDYAKKVRIGEEVKNQMKRENSVQDLDLRAAEKLTEKVAGKTAIAQQIDSFLSDWDQLSDNDKLTRGRGMIKVLNSSEGQDAVGAEEARRLADKLEFAVGNLTNDNPFRIGRDLPGFKRQAIGTSDALKRAAKAAQGTVKGVTGKESKIKVPEETGLLKTESSWTPEKEKRLQELRAKVGKK